jgi:hypothetical protein
VPPALTVTAPPIAVAPSRSCTMVPASPVPDTVTVGDVIVPTE